METVDVNAVAELARKSLATEVQTIKRCRDGDVPFVVHDNERTLKPVNDLILAFEKTQAQPYRRRGEYKAANIESLLAWMSEHCTENAPVFGEGAENLAATWAKPRLALLGVGNYSKGTEAAWHDFSVRYDFPVTLAWSEWVKKSGEWMTQADFSEFAEEHLYEFSEPQSRETLSEAVTRMIEALGGKKVCASPEQMYALSNGIKLNVSEKVEVKLDRASGQSVMLYTEEHTGAGGRPVAIPKFFYIRIPIFFGEPAVLIGALLRYRNAGGGTVAWSYELFAPDLTVKAEFDRICAFVKTRNRTLYLGTPDKP